MRTWISLSHAGDFQLIISEFVSLFNVIFYMANLADSKSSAARQDVTLYLFLIIAATFLHTLYTLCVCVCLRVCEFAWYLKIKLKVI